MTIELKRIKSIWLIFLVLIIGTNFAIYNTYLFTLIDIPKKPEVVIGTLLDLFIVVPLLICLIIKKFSLKVIVFTIATVSIFATLTIPQSLLHPYKVITNAGIFIEIAIITFELVMIIVFLTALPKYLKVIRNDSQPRLFAFYNTVKKKTKNPIIHIFASELILVYYALFSWTKKPTQGISMYKNSSYVAFQVMMIHAIILESIGLHWWLHSKVPVISIILLLINVYGVFFILADLQAMRLNPIQFTEKGMYISFGLIKRAYIQYKDIEDVITKKELLEVKKRKGCVEFICRDFEEVFPQVLIKMKSTQKVDFMYGIKKNYKFVSIKCDDPTKLITQIESKI